MKYRRPRWQRLWRTRFKPHSTYTKSSLQRILGGFLCLMGFGVILAAVPGWMYLMLLGTGLLVCGWVLFQKK